MSQSGPAPINQQTLLGVDVGGTFTDGALLHGGRLYTSKVPSTPTDQSLAVMSAVDELLAQASIEASAVDRFAHGMTVATNALLEEKGADTALLATRGFEDVLEIARQTRPELYKPNVDRASPLVAPEHRIGVEERCTHEGVLVELSPEAIESAVTRLESLECQAVAIALLHSYARPQHERMLAEAIRARLTGTHVSTSSELLPVFREYERTSTTVIDAYLSPLLTEYLERLSGRARAAGLPEPQVMQSNAGLVELERAARHAAWTVLSGPAGGTVAASRAAVAAGDNDALSFDMGGTSCDVAAIEAGRVATASARTIGGRALQLPAVDVHTVGAGGGSIAWIDPGGALRVGPHSAGADPGPACYGNGGREPTVTDANLILGYLGRDSQLAGGVTLDAGAAIATIAELGEQLALDSRATAEGILRVADQEMIRALSVVTVERGIDPRGRPLVAFGGAGPMHAARIAKELDISKVICPAAAGVLSAVGLAGAQRQQDFAATVMLSVSELTSRRLAESTDQVSERARVGLDGATVELTYELRYSGQSFELPVAFDALPTPTELREQFELAHERRYGYRDPTSEIELVNIRASARESIATGTHDANIEPASATGERKTCFDGRVVQATVVCGALAGSEPLAGPAVIETTEATVVVPPGWSAIGDGRGGTILAADDE